MIAKLKGLLDSTGKGFAVIDVGGVGYLVFCASRTLSTLPAIGEPLALHIETHIREDHIHLFGFPDLAERDWFRHLLTVQGVGAKVALAILGGLTPTSLLQAIIAQDKTALTKADGVGPKLAARIVAELRDKAGNVILPAVSETIVGAVAGDGLDKVAADAVSALVNLGYGRSDAFGAVVAATRDTGAGSVEIVITAALKELSA
ncbi:MAG: Holliday junction branch migration protein RuvA [Alphaproteobacteria bacterium]